VLEETGLAVSNVQHATVINHSGPGQHYVVVFMVADAEAGGEPSNPEPELCEGWAWHTLNEPLPTPVFPPLAAVLSLGFDPMCDSDVGRLLHAPDDELPPYCCAILHEESSGAIFLERRGRNAAVAAGQLTCFGGKRDSAEPALDCIRRELIEELGPSWWWPAAGAPPCKRGRASEDGDAPTPPSPPPSLRRATDLYVDGKLIAWFFEAAAPRRDAPLTFEEGRSGTWLEHAEWTAALEAEQAMAGHLTAAAADAAACLSPWHACVLRAWRAGQRRADYTTHTVGRTGT
jgi:8-oxo-dGTP pyrophosphatase MutT (NUDIX family)